MSLIEAPCDYIPPLGWEPRTNMGRMDRRREWIRPGQDMEMDKDMDTDTDTDTDTEDDHFCRSGGEQEFFNH